MPDSRELALARRLACSTLLLLLPSLGLGACRRGAAPNAGPPPAPEVIVEIATLGEFIERTEVTGRIVATETVELRPRISGHILEVTFHPGEIVEKDAVLFQIDPRWQEAAVARALATIESTRARVAVAEQESARAETLVAGKAISTEELQGRAGRVLEARAAHAAAEAELISARLDLEFTKVRAPIRGRVSRPLVTAGNYVSGVAGMTTMLTTIVAVDPVHFYADLDEASYLAFQPLWNARTEDTRIPIHLQLDDETGFPRTGFVESLDNQLDRMSGTILLRGEFENSDDRLVPGLFARAWIAVRPPQQVVFVDERAISTDQNQKYVLVVDAKDTAAYRKVELGPAADGKRVVFAGLTAGDRVIVQGHVRAKPGMQVKVVEPAAEQASGTAGTPASR